MGDIRRAVRLSSKELFIYYFKGMEGTHVGGCTNKKVLSKRTGIDYNTLMWNFTRKGRCYYENEEVIILKLHTEDIEKGSQSIARRGKGGMEDFMRYIHKNSY